MPRSQQNFSEPQKPRKKQPPFPFILDALAPLHPEVRPMFSGHAVYIGNKVVFMLRNQPNSPRDNGLWVVFADDFEAPKDLHPLREEFPSLRPIELLHGKIKHWLILPADSPGFESESLHACALALAHDHRLGRVPKSRQAKPLRR